MAGIPVEPLQENMANLTIVCREVAPCDDIHELTLDAPFTGEQSPMVEMRPRGLSIRSGPPMPTVPENTPETTNSMDPSVTGVSIVSSVGERLIRPATVRLETLQHDRPGIFWELDTTAPDNTPLSTSNLRPINHGLPPIEEIIPRLPPPRSAPRSNDGAGSVSDFDVHSIRSGHFNSARSEFGSGTPSASPNTRRVPPPTPATPFARSTITSPGLRSPAEPSDRPESPETAVAVKDGVLEFSDWEGDVEDNMADALARLAQLAIDKATKDPSKSATEYYYAKLDKIIKNPARRFRPSSIDLTNVPLPSPSVNPPPPTPTKAEVRFMDLRISQLETRVDTLMQFMENTIKARKE